MTVVPDSTTVTYQINQFFNTMVDHLGQVGESIEGNFATEAAQAVSAICVLFYLGWEMWPVIMGRRGPDIVKLLRPVLIAGVISAWPFFFLFFENIKTDLAMGARQLYATEQGDIMAAEKTMAMRIERMDSIRKKDLVAFLAASGNYDGMDRTSLESKDYDQLRNDYIDSEIKAGRQNRFAAGMIEFANCISTMVENVLKCIGQIALQAFFCGILVVGDFGTIVLGMFGPVMFGLSIAGAYRNHWAKWIEKYLCIALYPCLGYLAMAYVNWMILYYLEVECNITDTAISDWEKYVSVSYNHFGLIINYLVALFTGSYVMRAVPDLARAVFPGPSGNAAASAGAFVSGMTMATIGQAAKTAVAVTVGAVAAAGAATGAAVGGTMSESAKAAKAAKDSKDAFARKSKEKFDKLVNDKDSHGSSDLDGSSSYATGNRHASVNDGSSDSHGGGASNGYDSYGAYKPYDTSGTGRYKQPESDGENFEYRRGGEKKTQKSSYAPQRNNKHVRRGEHYRPDRFRYRFIPAKLRAYWGSSIGFLANFILADDTNANPQAWSAALGGIKGSARKAYALPWIFADHAYLRRPFQETLVQRHLPGHQPLAEGAPFRHGVRQKAVHRRLHLPDLRRGSAHPGEADGREGEVRPRGHAEGGDVHAEPPQPAAGHPPPERDGTVGQCHQRQGQVHLLQGGHLPRQAGGHRPHQRGERRRHPVQQDAEQFPHRTVRRRLRHQPHGQRGRRHG